MAPQAVSPEEQRRRKVCKQTKYQSASLDLKESLLLIALFSDSRRERRNRDQRNLDRFPRPLPRRRPRLVSSKIHRILPSQIPQKRTPRILLLPHPHRCLHRQRLSADPD